MAIRYNPKDAVKLIPPGEYEASIRSVAEKQSKAGNDMYVIKYAIYVGDVERIMTEYVVIPGAEFRLKSLAKALGKDTDFENGDFDPHDHINANLSLVLEVDKDGEQNKIKKHQPSQMATTPSGSKRVVSTIIGDAEVDPDCPF